PTRAERRDPPGTEDPVGPGGRRGTGLVAPTAVARPRRGADHRGAARAGRASPPEAACSGHLCLQRTLCIATAVFGASVVLTGRSDSVRMTYLQDRSGRIVQGPGRDEDEVVSQDAAPPPDGCDHLLAEHYLPVMRLCLSRLGDPPTPRTPPRRSSAARCSTPAACAT